MLIIRASLRDLKPQIAAILEIVDEEFEKVGCVTTVLTSCWRQRIASDSLTLHAFGYAADFDSEQMPEDLNDHKWAALRVGAKDRIGPGFDVLAHGPKAHLHVEWDEKVHQ